MTHDCCAKFGTNHIIKYADDTTMGRLLQGGGGAFHVSRDVLRQGTATTTWSWFRIKTRSYWSTSGKTAHIHTTLDQHQHSRERAAHSWEFMWWTICPGPCTPSKPLPALFWRLKRLHLSPDVITTSYRGTVESVRWQAACLSGQRAAVLQTKREECWGQPRGLFGSRCHLLRVWPNNAAYVKTEILNVKSNYGRKRTIESSFLVIC